jgi:hypothetical protein
LTFLLGKQAPRYARQYDYQDSGLNPNSHRPIFYKTLQSASFRKEKPHQGHAKSQSKSVAEAFQLDRFFVPFAQHRAYAGHHQARKYRTYYQAHAVQSRRMDDRMWKENEAYSACQAAQNHVNAGGYPGVLESWLVRGSKNAPERKVHEPFASTLQKEFKEQLQQPEKQLE